MTISVEKTVALINGNTGKTDKLPLDSKASLGGFNGLPVSVLVDPEYNGVTDTGLEISDLVWILFWIYWKERYLFP